MACVSVCHAPLLGGPLPRTVPAAATAPAPAPAITGQSDHHCNDTAPGSPPRRPPGGVVLAVLPYWQEKHPNNWPDGSIELYHNAITAYEEICKSKGNRERAGACRRAWVRPRAWRGRGGRALC